MCKMQYKSKYKSKSPPADAAMPRLSETEKRYLCGVAAALLHIHEPKPLLLHAHTAKITTLVPIQMPSQ